METPAVPNASPLPELRRTLHAFLRSRVHDDALAEDLAQETLLRIQSRLDSLRDAARFDAWAFQIARNVLTDHFRKARATEAFDEAAHGAMLPPAEEAPSAEDEALRERLHRYVRSVVDRLPPHYRDALRLTELEQGSQVDLARHLGLSVSAAKSRVQRGRALLRQEMERCCHWETDRYGRVLNIEPRSACRCDPPPRGPARR